jgi:hypothetical protein
VVRTGSVPCPVSGCDISDSKLSLSTIREWITSITIILIKSISRKLVS